ncbi:acyl-CoA N-acyltransferase [Lentithecium fluviatile CBS 122367]|uniref:Acyl-CoA N-acyltransferase n=1 Tax=Lentithecium fluviatile CBS 122367 TaxID=1168545 RepID=A0A6G1JHJ2_9PLEO|nr:acyl-CoA N-acyltransferase [Lentithecium fluviatile CBS 122367]
MSEVNIRFARYTDLPSIARVMGRAFFDDDLFGDIIHPYRKQYPEDVNLYWLRRAYVNFWNYRWRWLVAVTKDVSTGKEDVVGVAQWERLGAGGDKLECAVYDPRRYMTQLSSVFVSLHSLMYPNRASHPQNEDILERAYPIFGTVWSGDRAESWYLEWLAVHPDHQGKGIGQKLAQWGLDRAQEEGVWASVASTRGKEPFYQKCGFIEEYWSASSGEGNPLGEWGSGRIFWRRFGKGD